MSVSEIASTVIDVYETGIRHNWLYGKGLNTICYVLISGKCNETNILFDV